jgi:hypothetical protein
MKEGFCKLCGQQEQLVKSHSIPRRFFKEIKGESQHAVFYDSSITAKREATYVQAGVYDDDLLCENCERKFSEWDRYGGDILESPSLDRPWLNMTTALTGSIATRTNFVGSSFR